MISEAIAAKLHEYFNGETPYSAQVKGFAIMCLQNIIPASAVFEMDVSAGISDDGATFEFTIKSGKSSVACHAEVTLSEDYPDPDTCAQYVLTSVLTAIPAALTPAKRMFPVSTVPICLFKENKIFSEFSAFLRKMAANKKLSDDFRASLPIPEAFFIDKYDDHASVSYNGRELCRITGDDPGSYRLFNPYASPNADTLPRPSNIFEALCFAKVAEKAVEEALGG